jgi:hypothetical protein
MLLLHLHYMVKRKDEVIEFVDGPGGFDAHMAEMRKPKTWGGELEIKMLSERLQ